MIKRGLQKHFKWSVSAAGHTCARAAITAFCKRRARELSERYVNVPCQIRLNELGCSVGAALDGDVLRMRQPKGALEASRVAARPQRSDVSTIRETP